MDKIQTMGISQKYSSYFFAFLVSISALSLVACGGSSSSRSGGSTSPVAAPTVTSTAPADEEASVATNTKVVAAFDRDMEETTITQSSFTLQGASETAIVGEVVYNSDTFTATFAPNSGLTADTVYTGTVSTAAEDLSGISLENDFVWTFTTGSGTDTTAPTVLSTIPEHNSFDVVRNTKVTVEFSEAMDPDTLDNSSFELKNDSDDSLVSGTFNYINPATVVFSPASSLESETKHILSLSADLADLAGNNLTPVTFEFTTGMDESSSPDVVDLKTSGNYVILAESAITTTGTTMITGDIGISPNALSDTEGFSPTLSADGCFATSSLVTGKIFAADMDTMGCTTPSILTTAVSDMQAAYTDAAGRTDPDFTELGAGEIGGLTLDPGLYKWGTGVLVTSDVTLNGSSDDVWIFQISGDLKLEDGRSVVLAGGALPENVFWQVEGQVTLQGDTTFNGIILTETAVEAKSLAVINGRALAQTAVTLIANEVNEPAQ